MNWERTRFGRPVLFYHWAAGAGGLTLLIVCSILAPFPSSPLNVTAFITLMLMHIASSLLHFQYSRFQAVMTFGAAFSAAALLSFGSVSAAWISAAGIFTATTRRVFLRQYVQRKMVPASYDFSLIAFNPGMASILWLAAGLIYFNLLNAKVPLDGMNVKSAGVVVLMFVAMNLLNIAFLYVSSYLQGNIPGVFLKKALAPALITEMAMAPAGILLAFVYHQLGIGALVIAGSSVLLMNLMLRNLSVARVDQETKVQQLTGLHRISRQILTLKDEEAILHLLHSEVPRAFNSTGIIVALAEDQNALRIVNPGFESLRDVFVDVLRKRVPLIVPNAEKEIPEVRRNAFLASGIRSLILVPIHTATRTFGVIGLYSEEASAFDDDQVQVLAMIGGEAALALENSQLYGMLTGKVSELERLNKQLRQVDRMKSEFLATISHELRTPLTTIKGYVDYIKREKMGPVSTLQQEGLAITQRNIHRLQRLIDDLLDYTRMEFKKSPLSLSVCSFDLLWSEVYEEYGEQITEKKIAPHVMIPPNLPLLYVDIQRITQVLASLVSNAVKFNKQGGLLWIEARTIERAPSYFNPELYGKQCSIESLVPVEISVRDSGVGIPPDAVDKIFDRFYQVDSSFTRRYGGTGLGLAIVKSVLDAHGTTIQVSSSVGEGSTFSFIIPGIQAENLRETLKGAPIAKHSRPKYVT